MTSKIQTTFTQLHFHQGSGKQYYCIFYPVENGKSKVMDAFYNLDQETKDEIKSLIIRLATVPDYKSPKIRSPLEGYTFSELKPHGHRFFYFQHCGNNYIFSHYSEKKKNSLGSHIYQKIEVLKEYYAKEFEKYLQRNQ